MDINSRNILLYAEKYNNRYKGTSDEIREVKLKNWLKRRRYLNRKKLIDLGMWKSPRQKKNYEKNNDSFVKDVTKISLSTNNEELRIKILKILKGVDYPVASVILHFAFPNRYPILDFRVIESLGWQKPKSYSFDFWQRYCNKLRKISKKIKKPLRIIDKSLWEYSKEN